MRCTLSFDKKCFCCGAIFLNSVTGWNWTIFWSWTRVCFDASLFLPETGREPLHLGTRARCTSCPRGSDFRSKCIRRSQFFRWNCIPSLNLIEMHGSEGLTSVHWSTRCALFTVHWPLEHKMQPAPKPIRWDRRNPSQPLISPIWEKCSHALLCISFVLKILFTLTNSYSHFHPDDDLCGAYCCF